MLSWNCNLKTCAMSGEKGLVKKILPGILEILLPVGKQEGCKIIWHFFFYLLKNSRICMLRVNIYDCKKNTQSKKNLHPSEKCMDAWNLLIMQSCSHAVMQPCILNLAILKIRIPDYFLFLFLKICYN